MVHPDSEPKLFFTIQDNKGDHFYTSIAKHPVAETDGAKILKADFAEKYSFTVTPETEFLTVKVMAALIEKQEQEITTTSEKMIQAFKYRLPENYTKLFDQKHHAVQMNNNTCAIGLRIRWLHNADVIRLEEKQADLAKKIKALERDKSQYERIVKMHKQLQQELDKI